MLNSLWLEKNNYWYYYRVYTAVCLVSLLIICSEGVLLVKFIMYSSSTFINNACIIHYSKSDAVTHSQKERCWTLAHSVLCITCPSIKIRSCCGDFVSINDSRVEMNRLFQSQDCCLLTKLVDVLFISQSCKWYPLNSMQLYCICCHVCT